MEKHVRLDGQEIVVTGATDGIGKVTARELAKMGASVTIVGRDPAKGERVVREIRASCGHDNVRFVQAELSSLKDVRGAAEALKGRLKRLDVLVNNAGALFQRREVTADGIERTFALNHLAYFLLTALLVDLMKASGHARIVNVASRAHEGAQLDLDDLQNARRYSGWRAYQRSKLANVHFTYELARRLKGSRVSANCLHPGFVASSFGNNNGGFFSVAFGIAKSVSAISVEEGAKTSIHLASSPEVAGVSGAYFDRCKPVRSSPESHDESVARALWAASEKLVGVTVA
jgi:NAD(P)-dependent dehydrogenase (short-subunit alcohol dehydrogenase family)